MLNSTEDKPTLTGEINSPPQVASPQDVLGNNGRAAVLQPAANDHGQIGAFACHECGKAANLDRRFCGHCGTLLWEPCLRCGVKNSSNVAYCGGCGTNLAQVLAATVARLETQLRDGEQLLREAHFDQALAVLAELPETEHTQLKTLLTEAKRLAARIVTDREMMLSDTASAFEAARQYAEGYDLDRAQAALEAVPPVLRNEEFSAFLAEVQRRNQLITSLGLEIKRAVQAKQIGDLMPKVQKLLTLKPDHREGLHLAAQLEALELKSREKHAAQLLLKAKECVKRFQYEQAVELLQTIDDKAWTPEIEQLNEYASELAWLVNDLRTSPVVDRHLLDAAERLVKLQPNDEKSVQLCAQLRERAAKPLKPMAAAATWAKPPETTHLGRAVQWLGGFGRIGGQEQLETSLLREHPGRFVVAAGLALQGLGLGPIQINLLPSEKASLLGRFAPLMRKKISAVWGIDLGPSALKAVRLRLNEAGEAVVDAVELIEHDKQLNRPEAENERSDLIAQTLAKFTERHDLKNAKLCVGFPGAKVLCRFVKLPPMDAARLPDAVAYEARHQIPIALEDLVWDYHAPEPPPSKKELKKKAAEQGESPVESGLQQRVVIAAAREQHVKEHLFPWQEAGLPVEVVQSDALALYNFLAYEHFSAAPAGAPPSDKVWALVDLGCDTTNVVIGSAKTVWFRSFGRGGDDFSRMLMRRFNLTFAQAEQLKRTPTKNRRLSQIDDAYASVFQDLANDLQLSLTVFSNEYPAAQLDRVHFTGGGFQAHGFYRYLLHGK